MLFNVFISDLFLVVDKTDFASYVDGATIYEIGDSIDEITFSLQESLKIFLGVFLITNSEEVLTNVSSFSALLESVIKYNFCEKLLGMKVDSEVNFNERIRSLC